MSKDTEKIIVTHTLDNGLQVKIIDKCRLVAGDRWYLKITCVTTGSYSDEQCKELLNDEQYQSFVEKYPQGKLTFQYDKERNFIDDAIKDEALQELVDQIADLNIDYMGTQSFADNLFKKTVEEFVQEFNVRKEMGLLKRDEDIEEPDDFSACFK